MSLEQKRDFTRKTYDYENFNKFIKIEYYYYCSKNTSILCVDDDVHFASAHYHTVH